MHIIETEIPDVKLIEPEVFGDDRGFFFESFNQQRFQDVLDLNVVTFVQDNHSRSQMGVVRGIHYQNPPFEQGKLVRVVRGEVFDVAVDLRPESIFFGKYVSALLTGDNHRQLWIPEGFGHGFLTLSDEAEFLYKTTNYYSPKHEITIAWNDPILNVEWPIDGLDISLSKKDSQGISLEEMRKYR